MKARFSSLAAALAATVPAPAKPKRNRVGKPRAAPKSIDDIDMPAGQRIICYWPPIGCSPNNRLHPLRKHRIAQGYRRECWAVALAGKLSAPSDGPFAVQLDFFPPRRGPRDDDNAIASFKHGRDGIAQAMRVDDSRFRIVPVWHDEPRNCVAFTILSGEGA